MRRLWLAGLLVGALAPSAHAPGLHAQPNGSELPSMTARGERESPILHLPTAALAEDMLHAVELERGRAIVFRTGYPYKRVAVADPEIADVVVLGEREIEVVAKAVGGTNLLIWDANGRLQSSVEITVSPFRRQIVDELRRVLQNPDIDVDLAGDSIVLRGTVQSLEESEKATRVAKAFFAANRSFRPGPGDPPDVINLLDIGGNQQVMIDVKIAEMARTVSRNLGVNIHGIIGKESERFRFSTLLANLTGFADFDDPDKEAITLDSRVNLFGRLINSKSLSLDLFLEALHEKGLVRILAEPTLVARSGQIASFLVGGEIPIPVPQGGTESVQITIEFKKFGVNVEFTPTVLGPDRIHMQVSPEVSEPDFNAGVKIAGTAVPAFITRRASTAVELADGQSFAIAGLLREDITSVVRQYPVLGDVPILGALFRSTEFQKRETELVMIIRARLVKPLPPGPVALPTDYYIEPTAFETYALGRIEGKGPRATPGLTADREFRGRRAPRPGLIGDFGHRLAVPAPIGTGT